MKKFVMALFVLIFLVALSPAAWAGDGDASVASRSGVTAYGPIYDGCKLPNDPNWGPAIQGGAVVTNADEYPPGTWPTISGAQWISTTVLVPNEGYLEDSWRWFHDEMKIPYTAYNIQATATLQANADNALGFWFNGIKLTPTENADKEGELCEAYYDNGEHSFIKSYTINPQAGVNTLDFVLRNYPPFYPDIDGSQYADDGAHNPTGLIYKTTSITYKVPDVVWLPPVTNDEFGLQYGTTVPLKFQLVKDGTPLTTEENVQLQIVNNLPNSEPVVTWSLGDGVDNLRFDPYESCYIANFQTKNFTLVDQNDYTARVVDGCSGTQLGSIGFMVDYAKGTGRGRR
jgi:hypothetical protein